MRRKDVLFWVFMAPVLFVGFNHLEEWPIWLLVVIALVGAFVAAFIATFVDLAVADLRREGDKS